MSEILKEVILEKINTFISIQKNKMKLNRSAIRKGIMHGNNVSLERQAGYTPVLQIQ